MRRGQAEIIGLVVVVLLLIFALIFFVKIKSSDNDNESRLIRSNLRANSALNALMKVHLDNKKQMKDLVEECVDSGKSSSDNCISANEKLGKYLIGELGIFNNEKHRLIVSMGGIDLISSGNICENSISASPFILKNGGKVELKICT